MAINHELLSQIEASADEWGPSGKLGNDAEHVRVGKEDDKLEERLGLHPGPVDRKLGTTATYPQDMQE